MNKANNKVLPKAGSHINFSRSENILCGKAVYHFANVDISLKRKTEYDILSVRGDAQ